MSTSLKYPPFSPYLTLNNAASVIDFYKKAFGAQERYRLTDQASGKIGHAELTIGGQVFMVGDEHPGFNTSPKTLGGCSIQLVLMVEDVDRAYATALAAGAAGVRPPTDEFYGFRSATIADPAGHLWMIQHEVEKLSPEEIQQRWDAMLAKGCTESA